jgi:hypothetical protein
MTSLGYQILAGSECDHPPETQVIKPIAPGQLITVTLRLRPRAEAAPLELSDFSTAAEGAVSRDLRAAEAFARTHGLHVLASDAAGRSVVARGTASAIERAFGVRLHEYESPSGKYRGYAGAASVPRGLAGIVEAVSGLDSLSTHMQRFSMAGAIRP